MALILRNCLCSARAISQALKPNASSPQTNKISWTPERSGFGMGQKSFPKCNVTKIDLLWDQIFKTCRIYEEDPIKAWEEHEARLVAKAKVLNDEQFVKLHYTAPGTDLVLGMPKNHFMGKLVRSILKVRSLLPTCQQREKSLQHLTIIVADGYVTSTKPLSYNGNIIEGIKVTFKDGEIIDVTAEKGDRSHEETGLWQCWCTRSGWSCPCTR